MGYQVLLGEDREEDYLFFSIAVRQLTVKTHLTRAASGGELMSLLKEAVPDILFLSPALHCADGRNCLAKIRSDKRYDNMPVIMHSSIDDPANIEFAFRCGSNLYLIKPRLPGDLVSALERILAIDWKKTMYFPAYRDFVLRVD
jgi:CheY-like chemotaxis protein